MYVIETDLGRFEGETEKEAKALLRKARKVAHEEAKARSARVDLAYLRAHSNAYRLLRWIAEGRRVPWTIKPEQDRRFVDAYSRREEIYEHHHGKGSIRVSDPCALLAVVMDTGGWDVAVWLRDCDDSERLYALGIEGDEVAWVPVHGVTMAAFQRDEVTASA